MKAAALQPLAASTSGVGCGFDAWVQGFRGLGLELSGFRPLARCRVWDV